MKLMGGGIGLITDTFDDFCPVFFYFSPFYIIATLSSIRQIKVALGRFDGIIFFNVLQT
jgi:hypothetical protein